LREANLGVTEKQKDFASSANLLFIFPYTYPQLSQTVRFFTLVLKLRKVKAKGKKNELSFLSGTNGKKSELISKT